MSNRSDNDFALGFPPLCDADIHSLVLGSLPSRLSLQRGEYYAHPRNAFWRLMEDILDLPSGLTYERRGRAVVTAGVGLWDVLASSSRRGSLDADIQIRTAKPNDFEHFFRGHTKLKRVYFNGRKAAELFRRLGCEASLGGGVETATLPSTSPAFAAMPYAEKLKRWQVVARRPSP